MSVKPFGNAGGRETQFPRQRVIRPAGSNPPAAFPNRVVFRFHRAKRFALTRYVCRTNFRHQQETFGKVIHKFTEFTRPAPARHQRDTRPSDKAIGLGRIQLQSV